MVIKDIEGVHVPTERTVLDSRGEGHIGGTDYRLVAGMMREFGGVPTDDFAEAMNIQHKDICADPSRAKTVLATLAKCTELIQRVDENSPVARFLDSRQASILGASRIAQGKNGTGSQEDTGPRMGLLFKESDSWQEPAGPQSTLGNGIANEELLNSQGIAIKTTSSSRQPRHFFSSATRVSPENETTVPNVSPILEVKELDEEGLYR